MATLPADIYVNDNARTEGEMKQALEDFRDIFAQMIGGGLDEESLVISSGNVIPTRGRIVVDTEGAAGSDDLVTVSATNFPDGSLLLIRQENAGRYVTLKHGVGADNLFNQDYGDITLVDENDYAIYRRGSAGLWGLWFVSRGLRSYQRSDMGLGNAAIASTGAGNGLDADTVDGSHASAFLGVSATAANATQLGGQSASNYMRKDAVAGTQVGGGLWRNDFGQIVVRDNTAVNPQFRLEATSVRRAQLDWAADVLSMQAYAADGTTVTGGLRAHDDGALPQYYNETDTAWRNLAPVEKVNAASSSVGRFRVQHLAGSRADAIWWEKISTIQMPANLPTGESNVKCLLKFYASLTGSDNVFWAIHLGANNDESDPVVYQGSSGLASSIGISHSSETGGEEFTWVTGGHYLTLLLRNISGGSGTTSWYAGFMSVDIYPAAGFLDDTI